MTDNLHRRYINRYTKHYMLVLHNQIMIYYGYYGVRSDATGQDDHIARAAANASHVPPVLRQLFERPASERSDPQSLAVFQPADWPPCPACADRLIAFTVATDARDELVAAAMSCYNSEHETSQYVYNIATDTVYFDQVCPGPETEPSSG
jgi:hypothetical protein